jgi:hypothetical protein
MRLAAVVVVALLASPTWAQTRRPARKPTPPPAAVKAVAPEMSCPTPLGVGVATKQEFCDVMAGRDPMSGVIIRIPPHKGPVTLTFDLHNRHTYSEEQTRANRAYARYTATIGVLTLDNTLITRAVVQSEFRKASDLVDRIGGGAGPGGVKAVAPTGTESIIVTIPEAEDAVSLLGEKLTVERIDGPATYSSPGRPIAVINNVMIEYHPGPAKKGAPAARAKRE